MLQEALAGLTHGKGASEWAVTAYKDAQLVCLDPVFLSGVYCVNFIELVWDVLETLLFKNVPEMGWAHAAACLCFPVEHTISYLLENFGRAMSKLAISDTTAVKKTKILLADFGLVWSADKTGVLQAIVMEITGYYEGISKQWGITTQIHIELMINHQRSFRYFFVKFPIVTPGLSRTISPNQSKPR
ncbi:hypothetical protein DSO57_1016616 [Entomophthora muscae]|uniref:Uncharacterized protein n=1 Tax=Entomophthora muscae TaxID=34485 RepID=A0ACC2T4X3_9FUNG|nr:hypothetical protein DSO57_1016616 [Entomophthora muscae]